MAEPSQDTLAHIERLLRRIERLHLPDDWQHLTPAQLQLDSLDLVELQLELESVCDVSLFDDDVVDSPLSKLTMVQLAAHIDDLRRKVAPV
jgi:acyl carrier protein